MFLLKVHGLLHLTHCLSESPHLFQSCQMWVSHYLVLVMVVKVSFLVVVVDFVVVHQVELVEVLELVGSYV